MAQDKQALKPDTFISQLPAFVKEKEAEAEGATEEEAQLATMSRTAGWKVFKEYLGRIMEEMDELNERAIAGGATLKQIGENTVIITQVKQVINRALNRVADVKEASEKTK